jgi:RNA polymerase sigma-70 factor (ECF subfamily)
VQTNHRRDTPPIPCAGDLGLMAASVTTTRPRKSGFCALSLDIQKHLGERLAAVYSQRDAEPSLAHFADLLARLDAALSEAKGSDELAFRTGLLGATTYLLRFAMTLARDRAAADDLVQDTMLRAWRSRDRFQAGTNLEAWLATIMRNTFYSLYRKHTREVADSDGNYAARLMSLPEQSCGLDLQDMRVAIERLPAPMRQALMLVTVENLSLKEAACIIKCPIGTVKSRVWRARQQLAAILGYTGAEIGADGAMLSALGGSSSRGLNAD